MKVTEKDVKQLKNEFKQRVIEAGFSDEQAGQIEQNLNALIGHLTILDKALKTLPVEPVEQFIKLYRKHEAGDVYLQNNKQEANKLAFIAAMARTYQKDFSDVPATNVFGMNGDMVAA